MAGGGSPGGVWYGRSAGAGSEKPRGKIKREGNAGGGGRMAARSSVIIRC